MERSLRITGHLFFLLFFVFAVVFANERVLFVDNAYYLFKIINFEKLNIEYSRFPSVFTQLFTLIGVKNGASLHWLIVCFSVSFVVVYYAVYLLAVYAFRNAVAGMAIVFVLCLTVRHSFFHIVTETHQALVYSCLFYAWIMAQNATNFFGDWRWVPNLLAGIVIICLAGYSHPMAYVAMLFCVLYFMVEKQQLKSPLAYFMLALVILLGAVKYLTTPSGTYEGQFLSQIPRIHEVIRGIRWLPSTWYLGHYFWEMYSASFLLILVLVIHYLITSQLKKLVLVPAYFVGFTVFALLVFNVEDSRVMMERAFMPLALFAAIPFLNDVVMKGSIRFKLAKQVTVALLVAVSMAGIYSTSHFFSARIEYMKQFTGYMADRKSHKLLIDWKNTSNRIIYIPWAFAIETMLYSALQNPDELRTVFVYENIDELNAPLSDPDLFLCAHFDPVWKDTQLNPKYFRYPQEVYEVKREPFLKNDSE